MSSTLNPKGLSTEVLTSKVPIGSEPGELIRMHAPIPNLVIGAGWAYRTLAGYLNATDLKGLRVSQRDAGEDVADVLSTLPLTNGFLGLLDYASVGAAVRQLDVDVVVYLLYVYHVALDVLQVHVEALDDVGLLGGNLLQLQYALVSFAKIHWLGRVVMRPLYGRRVVGGVGSRLSHLDQSPQLLLQLQVLSLNLVQAVVLLEASVELGTPVENVSLLVVGLIGRVHK